MHFPSRWFLPVCLLVFLAASPWASAANDFAIGSIIRNFELPLNSSDSDRRSLIRGEEAIVVSGNEIRIRGLSIEIYRGDQLTTKITSAESVYWKTENKLTTDSEVKVTRTGMTITSKGMEWSMEQSSGIFRGQVKVTVTGSPTLITP